MAWQSSRVGGRPGRPRGISQPGGPRVAMPSRGGVRACPGRNHRTHGRARPRWNRSGLSAGVERETCAVATRKTTAKTAYSSSHLPTDKAVPQAAGAELVLAIRQHWGVESNSWIRDVRFDEDNIKTQSGHQAHVMGRLRGLAMEPLRKTRANNLPAAIETFMDPVSDLESMRRYG